MNPIVQIPKESLDGRIPMGRNAILVITNDSFPRIGDPIGGADVVEADVDVGVVREIVEFVGCVVGDED